MYDAIVVGTRVAGAPTAMLLARRGLKVLAVDRARFPSDTLSTHQVQVPGVARLAPLGAARAARGGGHAGDAARALRPRAGGPRGRAGRRSTASTRSTARAGRCSTRCSSTRRATPGAEVREGFAVDELLFEDGRVAGVRSGSVRERARVVVGADGRHSRVAKAVGAAAYHVVPARSIGYYTYWSGVHLDGGEMYARERRMIGAWPTNDGLVMTYVTAPADEFGAFRADPEGSLLRSLDLAGDLGDRVRAGERADRVYGTADTGGPLPRTVRPGLGAGRRRRAQDGPDHRPGDRRRVPRRRAGWRRRSPASAASPTTGARRDAAALPMYEMTADLASVPAAGG